MKTWVSIAAYKCLDIDHEILPELWDHQFSKYKVVKTSWKSFSKPLSIQAFFSYISFSLWLFLNKCLHSLRIRKKGRRERDRKCARETNDNGHRSGVRWAKANFPSDIEDDNGKDETWRSVQTERKRTQENFTGKRRSEFRTSISWRVPGVAKLSRDSPADDNSQNSKNTLNAQAKYCMRIKKCNDVDIQLIVERATWFNFNVYQHLSSIQKACESTREIERLRKHQGRSDCHLLLV